MKSTYRRYHKIDNQFLSRFNPIIRVIFNNDLMVGKLFVMENFISKMVPARDSEATVFQIFVHLAPF